MNGWTGLSLTPAQKRLVGLLEAGDCLWWYGDNGPEVSSVPCWPQKRTVRALLRSGVLRWKPYRTETQRMCGICELQINQSQPKESS